LINLKLNKRLSLVAEKVLSVGANAILDVGCDHAFLDIYLVQQNQNIRAVASDIHEGPIAIAKENIQKYGLSDVIETRVGAGIQTIDKEIDTIVISGMGGLNMIGILKYYPNLLKNVKWIILSPNNYPIEVREQISKLGFYLYDEDLVEERNFIYPVMVFQKGKKYYPRKSFIFSPILLEKKPPLFQKYLKDSKNQKEHICQVMPKKYFQKRWKLKREVKEIDKILESFKEKR